MYTQSYKHILQTTHIYPQYTVCEHFEFYSTWAALTNQKEWIAKSRKKKSQNSKKWRSHYCERKCAKRIKKLKNKQFRRFMATIQHIFMLLWWNYWKRIWVFYKKKLNTKLAMATDKTQKPTEMVFQWIQTRPLLSILRLSLSLVTKEIVIYICYEQTFDEVYYHYQSVNQLDAINRIAGKMSK